MTPRRPRTGDNAVVDKLVRDLLALPPDERMLAFAAAMIKLKEALHTAHPQASKRDLATLGQELGLRVLHEISAAAHREQLRDLVRKGQR